VDRALLSGWWTPERHRLVSSPALLSLENMSCCISRSVWKVMFFVVVVSLLMFYFSHAWSFNYAKEGCLTAKRLCKSHERMFNTLVKDSCVMWRVIGWRSRVFSSGLQNCFYTRRHQHPSVNPSVMRCCNKAPLFETFATPFTCVVLL